MHRQGPLGRSAHSGCARDAVELSGRSIAHFDASSPPGTMVPTNLDDFLAECDDLCLAQHIQYKADDALVKQIGRYPVIHPCQDMKLGKGIML